MLGTVNFGQVTEEADSHAIMDAAHAAGLDFFDTADVYGWAENRGRTGEIIGCWFAKGGGRREKTVLATKVYGDMAEWPNNGRLSALNIRRTADAGRRRSRGSRRAPSGRRWRALSGPRRPPPRRPGAAPWPRSSLGYGSWDPRIETNRPGTLSRAGGQWPSGQRRTVS
ncbi:hypothetical protein GCM10009753_32340 [Streptantibioticus ferralitis]